MGFQRERPVSPLDGWWIKDDFASNDLLTDNNIGEGKWQLTAIGNTGTFAYVDAEMGVLRHTTVATADGDGDALHTDADGLTIAAGTGGGFSFRFRYPDVNSNTLTANDFRIGLDDSVTATAPAVGISVFSDAGVLNLRSDSSNGDKTVAVSGVSTLTSGTTAVLDTWHTVEVTWSGTNGNGGPDLVEMLVDGEEAASLYSVIGSSETVEAKIVHYQNSGIAADYEFDLDYVEFFMWR